MAGLEEKVTDEFDEFRFQSWYKKIAETFGLNVDPDDPEHFYDYRAAYKSGEGPDQFGKWPSKYKKQGHKDQFMKIAGKWIDTITGKALSQEQIARLKEFGRITTDEQEARIKGENE